MKSRNWAYFGVLFVILTILVTNSHQVEGQEPSPLIFTDDFSIDKGWIDESEGYIYRDAVNEWLVYQIVRNSQRRYYYPINARSDYIRLSFRFKVDSIGGNGNVIVGLTESLYGAQNENLMASGYFLSIQRDGGGRLVHPYIRYTDRPLQDPYHSVGPYEMYRWYRVELEIDHGDWVLSLFDSNEQQVGQMSGTLPAEHGSYPYLMVFRDQTLGWEWHNGVLDDFKVWGHLVNSSPTAEDDIVTTSEDTAVTIDVLGNDSDPDFDPLTVTSLTEPSNGSVLINPDNSITYTPEPNSNGIDSFSYTISDGNDGTDTAAVDITVTAVNDEPILTLGICSQEELVNDEFKGSSLDGSLWHTFSNGNGHYVVSGGLLKVVSGTAGGGFAVLSDELYTDRLFSGLSDTLVLETRIKVDVPYGGEWGFSGPSHDGNLVFFSGAYGVDLLAYFKPHDGDPVITENIPLNPTQWFDYRIEFEQDETRYYVDESLILTVPDGVEQDNPMEIRLGKGSDYTSSVLLAEYVRLTSLVNCSDPIVDITADEGQSVSNNGTVKDADGDTVTLNSSVGEAVNNGDGTWSWNHTTDDGPTESQTVYITGDDGNGGAAQASFDLVVNNVAPMGTFTSSATEVDEGGSVDVEFSDQYDPSGADTNAGFHYAFDCSGGSLTSATYASSGTSNSISCIFADNGSYTVSGKIVDKDDGATEYATTVTVDNVAPTVTSITVPWQDPIRIDDQSAYGIDVAFSDPAGAQDEPYTCDFDIDYDGTTFESDVAFTTTYDNCSTLLDYVEPGVYRVMVVVTDRDGGFGTATATDFIVIYDSEGGFVTGGGWIDSPQGAYTADPSLTGKANFGFVSKYKKGANVPIGNTEFQFKAGDMNFHSSSYDWLVVAGKDKAKYKGAGTINGNGNFGFMLTAIDGSPDTFRIKIWDKDAGDMVVYDNKLGEADTGYAGTVLGGGNIVVHTGKK